MIPVIEDYLSELLESKIKYLKEDPDRIDKILATTPKKLKTLKDYISTKDIHVRKGFPIEPNKLPTIAILLGNEEEEQGGLGDFAEDDDINIKSHTETLTVIDMPNGKLAMPYVQLTYKPLVSVSQIFSETFGTILEEREYFVDNEPQALIGFLSGMLEGGDEVTVTYTYRDTSEVSIETMYEHNFRLEVWSQNADLVAQLYAITKWALLSGRDYLVTSCGLYRQRLSGADLQPDNNMAPALVYRRGLNFWCQADSSAPTDEIDYVSGVLIEESIAFDTEKDGD